MNGVALFKVELSLASLLIALITWNKFTHAAIIRDGIMYDASESRGNVGKAKPLSSYKGRKVEIYSVPSTGPEIDTWIQSTLSTEYDWQGVLGWVLNICNPKKYFCFTYALAYAKFCLGKEPSFKGGTSSKEIIDLIGTRKVFKGKAAAAAAKFKIE